MKRKSLSLIIVLVALFSALLLGGTEVKAFTPPPRDINVYGLTEKLDIATTTADKVGMAIPGAETAPAILAEDFKKVEVKELVRGKTYILWANDYEWRDNCTLSVNGVTFGTLEKTDKKLYINIQGDGQISAYRLTISENAILPTETVEIYGRQKYSINTTLEKISTLFSSDIKLISKEKPNTIISNDPNSSVSTEITGNISTGATLSLNKVEENTPLFSTMQTAVKNHISSNFSQYDTKVLFVKDIKIDNGTFNGKLTLTFDIGAEYNGMKFAVAHQKQNNEIEYFNGIVANGKAIVEVTELSPFVLSILTEKETITNNEPEKDNTPKTGTTDIIYYIIALTVVAGIGTIAFRKNKTN